jgi:hypothetical protein
MSRKEIGVLVPSFHQGFIMQKREGGGRDVSLHRFLRQERQIV